MCARRFLFVIFILTLLLVAAAVAMFQFGNRVLIKSAIPKGHYVAPGEGAPGLCAGIELAGPARPCRRPIALASGRFHRGG